MSKIPIQNIYYMLAYAFTNLKFDDIKNISAEEFKNIYNLFAAILSEGIGKILKQDLHREYINHSENLSTVRGKIILPSTMQNFISGRRKIFCEFDELSEYNLFNQILKTTAKIFLRIEDVEDKYKNLLKRELYFFANVEEIKIDSLRWENLHWQKNNQTYQLLINLCKIVLRGMIFTTDDGKYKLQSFGEKNLAHLYEKFLLTYYQKNFPQLKPQSKQIAWALDDDEKKFPACNAK